jgi:hypothetical protein
MFGSEILRPNNFCEGRLLNASGDLEHPAILSRSDIAAFRPTGSLIPSQYHSLQ